MGSLLSFSVIVSALELGFIYALVALALFLSYSILNIADLSTDGCFTLGCAVGAQVAIMGHPILALNKDDEIVGYEFISLGKMMDFIKKGDDANEAMKKATGHYGQWDNAAKYIDPRHE